VYLAPVGHTLDEQTLSRTYTLYFGVEPPREVQKLFAKFPEFRGFSQCGQDRDQFRTALMIGLLGTHPEGNPPFREESFQGSYLLHPKGARGWVLESVKAEAAVIFTNLREHGRDKAIPTILTCFQKLRMGHQVLQLPEPPRWAAIGFERSDPIPEWMRIRLMP
jgi:hypothetical protein